MRSVLRPTPRPAPPAVFAQRRAKGHKGSLALRRVNDVGGAIGAAQIEDQWTPEMLQAPMKPGQRSPDIAAELVIVASDK